MERAQWSKWVDFYEQKVTRSIVAVQLAAGFAADTQTFLDRRGLNLSIGPVFTQDDLERTQTLLNVYNTLGRLMTGVNSSKYGIRLAQGDIDILAPPDMPVEEYRQDKLEAFGAIPLIIYAIVVGATLVGGLWATSNIIKSQADRDFTKYKNNLIQADKEMMQKAPDVRAAWIQHRKEMERQENESKKTTGWLIDIFGSKIGGGIAAGALVLIGLLALRFIPRGKK